MNLKLKSFSVYESSNGGFELIGAELEIVFAGGTSLLSGTIGTTFPHPSARKLTFAEAEQEAIAYVQSRL